MPNPTSLTVEQLLPCGNCDAPARWVELAWRVKCTRPSCGVEGGKFETRREAVTAWNTRHLTSTDRLRDALAEYRAFAGETAGKCLGLAMSTDHPEPDTVLMGIFEASQALAAKWREALTSTTAPSGEREALTETAYKALRHYRMSNMCDEGGDGYPLVDLCSRPAPFDISDGEEQIGEMAACVADAFLALRAALQGHAS